MKQLFVTLFVAMIVQPGLSQDKRLYSSNAYNIYSDRVVQGRFEAKALSDKHIRSNYKSPTNEYVSSEITFKFAINGKDNEMAPGVNHHFIVPSGSAAETPVIVFGQQSKSKTGATYLKPDTRLTIRLDMREVLKQFNEQGFYITYKGDKIYKEDFKAVYVAGNTAPLMWDFDNLYTRDELKMKDEDGDGIYETTIVLNKKENANTTADEWQLKKDISAFPQYSSDHTIINALYNMALEEMENAVEKDSTLRTGKEWAGVWTRDVSYSIILSMAYLQPKVAMNSLMRKVNERKRIIQDTGTGGAWPVSTDRMIWAVAAFEVYKVTGDKNWLEQIYEIVKNSIEDDLMTTYDPASGLVKGESSFLDWREQTYPRWMQPADIFESECLGTNATHYQANMILARMASILNHTDVATKHQLVAENIKQGINNFLWIKEAGYYGQYQYGKNYKMLSPKSEALGEALTVLFDIADGQRQQQVVSSTPVTDFGIPCVYPQIPGIPPYHNNAVWPFVQSYWLWAGAKAGNEKSVVESFAAIYRPAAMFLTNKENFVADNGDFSGTQINSSNMLWSLSGNISTIHKVLFGINFNEDHLSFMPFVPKAYAGIRSLKNFKYRGAILNIEMEGYGNNIKSFTVDGKLQPASIAATLKGVHQVKIILGNELPSGPNINKVANKTSLESPATVYEQGKITWTPIKSAMNYRVFKNGQMITSNRETSMPVNADSYGEYQVVAVDANNQTSFASEPIIMVSASSEIRVEAETLTSKAVYAYKGFTGDGFVELNKTENTALQIPVEIPEDGIYAIDVRYANGNGPTNTENKCAIRSLKIDETNLGTIIMPQRGKDEWSNWGFSNAVAANLQKGKHVFKLVFEPFNENMNGETNQAMLDYVRVYKID